MSDFVKPGILVLLWSHRYRLAALVMSLAILMHHVALPASMSLGGGFDLPH
jgi:hypothetical protein